MKSKRPAPLFKASSSSEVLDQAFREIDEIRSLLCSVLTLEMERGNITADQIRLSFGDNSALVERIRERALGRLVPVPPAPPNRIFKRGWFGLIKEETKESKERGRQWERDMELWRRQWNACRL